MNHSIRAALSIGVLVLAILAGPSAAYASAWPFAEQHQVVLRFAETYLRPDGTEASHGGVDIEAPAGSRVAAAFPGTVTFAGSVPAGTGTTMLAVTVETADGDRWSYMPLTALTVRTGDQIAAGGALGELAASGDSSYGSPHLHVGLRRSGRYVDPLSLLVPPAAAVREEPAAASPVPAPALAPAPAPSSAAPAAVPAGAPVAGTSPAAAGAPAAAPAAAAVPKAASAAAPALAQAVEPARANVIDPRSRLGRLDGAPREAAAHAGAAAHAPGAARARAADGRRALAARVVAAFLALPLLHLAGKRMRSECVTAPGDTVAATVGR